MYLQGFTAWPKFIKLIPKIYYIVYEQYDVYYEFIKKQNAEECYISCNIIPDYTRYVKKILIYLNKFLNVGIFSKIHSIIYMELYV